MSIMGGWLSGVRHVVSPNCDERPDAADIALIVIHCISLPPGEFGGEWVDRLFTNTLPSDADPYFADIVHLRVAAHLFIRRDGEVVQYVPFHKRAWHAGVSSYRGRVCCNDFSIGIELEGVETLVYTDIQYSRLTEVIGALLSHYPRLSVGSITGHSDIAPDRKTDPGDSFDWGRLRQRLAQLRGEISTKMSD